MVEEHSPEFVDAGEKQKIDFFKGDVHLGHYDFRFDFNDKKHFSISKDDVNENLECIIAEIMEGNYDQLAHFSEN